MKSLNPFPNGGREYVEMIELVRAEMSDRPTLLFHSISATLSISVDRLTLLRVER
jgi:hypothetical protein